MGKKEKLRKWLESRTLIVSLFLAGNIVLLLRDMIKYNAESALRTLWANQPISHDLFIALWVNVLFFIASISINTRDRK